MVTIPWNIVIAPVRPQKHAEGYVHNYNNCHSVSCFPFEHIVESNTSTYIKTLSDCFPERTVTLDVKSTINCQFITMVSLLCSLV